MTNRLRKLQFLEKVKRMVLDNSADLAMRQVTVHIASIIIKSGQLDMDMHLCCLDFMLVNVSSEASGVNIMLIFMMIAHKMMEARYVFRSFVNECNTLAQSQNCDILPKQIGCDIVKFANILEGRPNVNVFIARYPDHDRMPGRLSVVVLSFMSHTFFFFS